MPGHVVPTYNNIPTIMIAHRWTATTLRRGVVLPCAPRNARWPIATHHPVFPSVHSASVSPAPFLPSCHPDASPHHRHRHSCGRVRQPPSCADPAPSPSPAGSKLLSAPRVPEHLLILSQLAVWLRALWPSVLYLLDDPYGALDGGGSATQARMPLAKLWACFSLALRFARAGVGSGGGASSVVRIPRYGERGRESVSR